MLKKILCSCMSLNDYLSKTFAHRKFESDCKCEDQQWQQFTNLVSEAAHTIIQ